MDTFIIVYLICSIIAFIVFHVYNWFVYGYITIQDIIVSLIISALSAIGIFIILVLTYKHIISTYGSKILLERKKK